ncbi:hypothetical protein ACHELS_004227 [Vibrio vulnificus]|uniref:hypothetical protein n=1 Tax=Vibrio vulnificus TaxID=672 RepID=UPI0012F7219E|nr:hypothetical protein [Vibrio vulnificus]EJL6467360.1 hypothetical protein [Vibrio cholerae]HCH5323716.1 hypothetical protein [Vibrio parahaemolyticus]ELK8511028.1 hypothetical protein [Vibrio vulnificus]ELK8997723.1 hypothetical protein [Vibrio vulnificus]ELS3558083.1 hypothetical protein [Vibrio vulnificus]
MKNKIVLTSALIIFLIATPIYLYSYQFGFGLWSSHSRWGELGSFFGGVFGPIFSFISIVILSLTLVLTKKSVANSEIAIQAQLEQSRLMLSEQRNFFVIQQFETDFFNQLKLVIEHYNTAKTTINGVLVEVSCDLPERFDTMVKGNGPIRWDRYLHSLSTALEAFDQLVIMIEDQAPTDLDKTKYRKIVQSNLHVSFRWFIGQAWENLHHDLDHKKFLEEHYGIKSL